MIELLMNTFIDGLADWLGSYVVVALLFMVFFVVLAMFLGLPFDFALLLTLPVPYAFQQLGYLEVWVSGLLIVVVLGFSIYFIWNRFQYR